MTSHVHKDRADSLDLDNCCSDFVGEFLVHSIWVGNSVCFDDFESTSSKCLPDHLPPGLCSMAMRLPRVRYY